MRFLLYSLVSSSFLVLQRYSFKFFLSSLLIWWCPLSMFSRTCYLSFLSKRHNTFLIWAVLFLPRFLFLIFNYDHCTFFNIKFHSYIWAVYSYCLYQGFLFVIIFWQIRLYHPYKRWLILSCNFENFLSTYLSSIIALMNGISESESLRKMCFWIFTSAKVWPLAINSTRLFSMAFWWSLWFIWIFCSFSIHFFLLYIV